MEEKIPLFLPRCQVRGSLSLLYVGLQARTDSLPDFMCMFSSIPIKNRYDSPFCKDLFFFFF